MKRSHAQPRNPRPTILATAVACCFAPVLALANPTGPTVAHGAASFSTQGKLFSVTNSPGTIINWKGFSIAAGETTRFVQQSASSAVLNRVVGVDPSTILGALQSNGRVFLVNPSGILIGAGAQIDTAGFVASTLNIMDADFLTGKLRFGPTPGAGPLSNAGEIRTPLGGRVLLISPQGVENSGIIHSPKGEVILAAGKTVELADSANPEVRVEIAAPDARAINLGKIVAESGRIGIYGGVVANRGVVSADSAVVGESGRIVFKATREASLDAGSITSASGKSGGSVVVEAGTTVVSGAVKAIGSDGQGGDVRLLGDRVALAGNGSVDVSGDRGGGTALVGGDFQGTNAAVRNAQMTYVGADASIKADAGTSGDGGKVIVWADDTTRSYGTISARGGRVSGNGGLIETSGKIGLDVRRGPDVRAPAGKPGTWLIDPNDLEVVAGEEFDPSLNTGAPFFAPLADSSRIGVDLINAQLDFGSNVVLTTTSRGTTPGTQAGNITISAPIVKSASSTDDVFIGTTTLTLQAHNNIVIAPTGSIVSTGDPLNVTLQANIDGVGGGSVTVNGPIVTRGGSFFASNSDLISINAPINTLHPAGTFGGSIQLNSANGGVLIAAPLVGGFTSANAAGGAVTVASAIASTSSVSLSGRDGVTLAGGSSVTTGPFASFSATVTGAGGTLDIQPGATVSSRGASFTADNVNLQGTIDAADGSVSLRQRTVGREISLGTEVAGKLSVTQLEFDNVNTTGSFFIGDPNTGAITVNGMLSGDAPFVSVSSGTSFTQNAGVTLTGSLNINAPIITIAAPLTAAGASGITFVTDDLNISSAVNASGGNLDINARSFFRTIRLGVSTPFAGAMELTDAEQDRLMSPTRVRFSTSGPINIVGPISPAGSTTLSLSSSSSSVAQSPSATITVPNLAVSARTSINLPEHNAVDNLAAQIFCCSAGDITFVADPGRLVNITTVDGISGVTVNNFSGTGNIMLQADDLNVAQVIRANLGNVKLFPETATRTLTLGGDVAGTLSLNNTEIGRVQGTNVTFAADTFTVAGPVTFNAATTTLAPFTTDRLVKVVSSKSGGAVEFTPAEIGNMTGATVVLGGPNAGPVTVETGLTVPGTISNLVFHSAGASSSFAVNLSSPVSATNSVGVIADSVALNDRIDSSSGSIAFTTHTPTRKIDLGSDPGGSMGLDTAEIGRLGAPAGTISFNTAGGNIEVQGSVAPAAAAAALDAGGTITVFTAATLDSTGRLSLRAPTVDIQGMSTVEASAGSLDITTDSLAIGSTAVVRAVAGDINIKRRSFGNIALGGTDPGGVLHLTDPAVGASELDSLFTPAGILRIGATDGVTGNISVIGALTSPGRTLSLKTSAGRISQTAGSTIDLGGAGLLAAQARDDISLSQANVVGTIAMQTQFDDIAFVRAPGGALDIGSVDGLAGIQAGIFTFPRGDVTLRADQININQSVSGNVVSLFPTTAGAIDIGTKSGFGITQAEFDRIFSTTVVVGDSGSGNITVSAPITVSTFSDLALNTGSTRSASVGADLSIPGDLTISAGTLTTTANVTSTGGDVLLAADAVTLGPTVSAAGTITVRPLTATNRIGLGAADSAGITGVDATDLGNLSAPNLVFGNTPRIDITAPLTTAANVFLQTDDLTATANFTAPNVFVSTVTAGRTIDLGTAGTGTFMGLDAATLARFVVSGALSFSDNGGTGTILVSAPITSPAPDLSLAAGTININESLSAPDTITLRANNPIAIAAGKTVSSSGGGDIIVARRTAGAMAFGAGGLIDSTKLAQLVTTGFLELGSHDTTSSLSIAQPLNAGAFNGLLLLASGNISQTAGSVITASKVGASSANGDVLLNENNVVSTLAGSTGFFRTFSFTSAAPLTVGTVDTLAGVNAPIGQVTLRSDGIDIVNGINANVVTLAPRLAGTPVTLGADTGYGLTDAEIDLVGANSLIIGVATGSPTGPITVVAPVDYGAALSLRTAPGSSIAVNAALGSSSGGAIAMDAGAGGSVNIAAPVASANSVTVTADSIVTSAPITVDFGSVTLTNVGLSGSVIIGGPIDAFNSIGVFGRTIVVNAPLTAHAFFSSVNLTAPFGSTGSSVTINQAITAGNSINVITDDIAINAPLVTTGSSITLQTRSSGRPISVGTEKAGAFSLSAAELALLETDSLSIGAASSGDLEVNAPLSGEFEALTLRSGGDITQTAGAPIAVDSLAVFATGSIDLPEPNEVANSLTGSAGSGDYVFNNVVPLKLQNVSGVFASGRVLITTSVPPPPGALAPDSLLDALLSDILKATDTETEIDKQAEERKDQAEKDDRQKQKERGTQNCS